MMFLKISQTKLYGLIVSLGLSASAMGSPLTWVYDADDNALPDAVGQPFEGGSSLAGTASLIDLGAGDIVLGINTQDTDTRSFFQQDQNTNAGREWDVNPAVGYSLEWRVRFDGTIATDAGSADLLFLDGVTASSIRLSRGAGASSIDLSVKSALNNTLLATANLSSISSPAIDPDAFFTIRVDVLNTFIDVYVDGVILFDDVVDPTSSTLDFVRIGDGTVTGDGKYQTQFLRTYQQGVIIPEPTSFSLLCFGLVGLVGSRGRRAPSSED